MLQNIITLLPHYSEEHFSVFTSNLSRRTIVCSFLFYNKQTSKKTTLKKLSGYEKCGVWCKWLSNDGGVGGGAALMRSPQKCARAGSQQLVPHPPDSDFLYSCLIQFTWSNAALLQSGINLHFCVNHIVYLHHIILCKSLQHFIM